MPKEKCRDESGTHLVACLAAESGGTSRGGAGMNRLGSHLGRILAVAVAASLAVAALYWFGPVSVASASVRPAASTGPCGIQAKAPAHYKHVIWVWMENHSYSTIIGASAAPYINSLASQCGLATNYHNITHLSLANYVGATSGLSLQGVQEFTGDCNPSLTCDTTSASLFGQAKKWRAYEEGMPSSCDTSSSGEYAVRHNPPLYFTTLKKACPGSDVAYTKLASDLAANTLPAFAFVTPNLIDDMHDGTIAQGDSWLSTNIPTILNSSAYKSGSVVVFITWDEGEGGSSNDCATNTTDIGCHVATLVVSPSTKAGTSSASLFSHYSLLRTTEELLGLPLLGQAKTANSMKLAFNL